MMYTRAAASDYDDWESVYENPGWGSNDLIPLLKKVSLRIHLPACSDSDHHLHRLKLMRLVDQSTSLYTVPLDHLRYPSQKTRST